MDGVPQSRGHAPGERDGGGVNAPAVAENAENFWRELAAWWHRRLIPLADNMAETALREDDKQRWRDNSTWHRECLGRHQTCKVDG